MSNQFKRRVNRKYLGTYRPRIDSLEKASGRAEYIDDITLKCRFPNILYAKVLHSPYPHALIKSIDVSEAEKLPGVEAILTYKDLEIASLKPTNAGWTDGVDTVSYERMMWKIRDRRILGNHACWVGDEVGAVVAAKSERIGEEALRLIKVEWEVLPFVLDPIESMQPGAPVIHPELSQSNVLPAEPIGGADVFGREQRVERMVVEPELGHLGQHPDADRRMRQFRELRLAALGMFLGVAQHW